MVNRLEVGDDSDGDFQGEREVTGDCDGWGGLTAMV